MTASCAAAMDGACLTGWSVAKIVERVGVPASTARRWKRAKELPRLVALLVRVVLDGDLSVIDPAWRGWSLKRGALVGPDGLTFTPADVLSQPFYVRALAAAHTRERFAVQADFIDGRYVDPAEIPQRRA